MKLRNKKTGEVRDFIINKDKILTASVSNLWEYSTLAELNEEWEDYEEPKEDGLYRIITLVEAYSDVDSEIYPKEIVEKLKAWKRLKDAGFKFSGYTDRDRCQSGELEIYAYIDTNGELVDEALPKLVNDLDLLFWEVKND